MECDLINMHVINNCSSFTWRNLKKNRFPITLKRAYKMPHDFKTVECCKDFIDLCRCVDTILFNKDFKFFKFIDAIYYSCSPKS